MESTKKTKSLQKTLLVLALALSLVFSLAACGSDSGDTESAETTETVETEETTDETSAERAAIPAEASADNTELSSGTWTGTIGDKTVTLNGAYIVDGIDAVIEGGTWTSESADETVFLVVNGGSLTIKDALVTKTGGGESGSADQAGGGSDAYNFYGLNSAIVCVGEDSTVSIENCQVDTDAEGANAVFSTAEASIEIDGITINTEQNSSRGLYSTYGGSITATDVHIVTQGAHCAPLATDRGGGTVTVTGSGNTLEAHGDGSPCIYSTGDISVEGATGSSEQSQTLVIEGKNKVTLKNCDLTSHSENDGVMLYQSMSGDAADKDASSQVSTLTMEDTTLHYDGEGMLFYITNTSTEVDVTNCTFDITGDTLISAATGRWGNEGSNGGTLAMTCHGQTLSGNVTADSISSVTLDLSDDSALDGDTEGSVTIL